MIRREDFELPMMKFAAPPLGNAPLLRKGPHCHVAEANDHLRLDSADLFEELSIALQYKGMHVAVVHLHAAELASFGFGVEPFADIIAPWTVLAHVGPTAGVRIDAR